MKATILNINDLNYSSEYYGKLEHISFHANAGEVTSLFGLSNSGRELLFDVISGNISLENNQHNIFINNHTIRTKEEMAKEVYCISSGENVIESWSVAEYLLLQKTPFYLSRKAIKKMNADAERLLRSYEVRIRVDRRLSELSIIERKMLEIIKAGDLTASILLLKNDFEGMSDDMLDTYSQLLHRVINNQKAVIFLSYIDNASLRISDSYLIFRRGRIVKKCSIEHGLDEIHRNAYLLGHVMTAKKQQLDQSVTRQMGIQKNIKFQIRNLTIKNKRYDFDFQKGEIVLLKVTEELQCRKVFEILSGHMDNTECGVEFLLNNQNLKTDYMSLFDSRIVSIYRIGTKFGIFENMSIGDNLLIPSLTKLSDVEYAISGDNIEGSMCRDLNGEAFNPNESARFLSINDRIAVMMERWFVFKPVVIYLFEPFTNCDIYGVSLIKSYVRKFSNKGTIVILIKANTEFLEEDKIDSIYEISD